jgi:phage repressor protein C with HTH and peptisase S24 domain
MPLTVPVRGVAVGGTDADFTLNGDIVDYVRRPPGLMNAKRALAIYVQGDSMEPRYEAGDLVYLNPDRPARGGDDVVIQMKPNGHKPGDCFIKRLVRRTPTQIICRQFNPPDEVVYSVDEVDTVFKVMTNAELMGV